MPTTLTGLLLFVVLLLPGFAYLVGKERHGTERRLSPFRETVAVVAASISSELVVLVIFAVIRTGLPSITPNVGALLREGSVYLTGSTGHQGYYAQFAIWGLGLLIAAVVLAYLATLPGIRRLFEWATGRYPHESTVSAWWVLFELWAGNRKIELACVLDDGSAVRGQFGSFNIAADDSPDRDLILQKPLYYRPAGASDESLYDVAAVCCSASRIVALFVQYIEPGDQSVTSSQLMVQPEAESAVVQPAEMSAAQGEAMSSEAPKSDPERSWPRPSASGRASDRPPRS